MYGTIRTKADIPGARIKEDIRAVRAREDFPDGTDVWSSSNTPIIFFGTNTRIIFFCANTRNISHLYIQVYICFLFFLLIYNHTRFEPRLLVRRLRSECKDNVTNTG